MNRKPVTDTPLLFPSLSPTEENAANSAPLTAACPSGEAIYATVVQTQRTSEVAVVIAGSTVIGAKGAFRERPTLEGMIAYMEEATQIVASWPQWKREVLRDPQPPSNNVVAL